MTPQQECLFDVAWQVRRRKLLTSYRTEEETRAAISDMLAYIGRAKTPYWKFVRVWRCRNLVTYLTRGAEKSDNLPGQRLLKKLSKGLEIEFDRYKGVHQGPGLFKSWSWGKVRNDLSKLYVDDTEEFKGLLAYTYARLNGPGKEVPTEMLARPELAKFVRLMRDVEFDQHDRE